MSSPLPRWLLASFASLFFALPALAQEEEEFEEAPITKYPSILEGADALYPPVALKQRIEAMVEMEIEISETGTISDALVVRTATLAETLTATTAELYGIVRSSTITDYGFATAALDALERMKFSPAEAEGVPIPVRVPYTYAFELPPLPPLPKRRTESDPDTPAVLSLSGTFRVKGTRELIPGVVVTAFRQDEAGEVTEAYEAVSAEDGTFALYDLQPGKWKIQGEAEGFFPARDTISIVVGEVTEVTYYLEKGNYSEYDVFTYAKRIKREVNRRTLTREEIRTVPGTLGDPILVVENLPGVARPPTGTGQIIVRGSGTNDTRVYIDGVEVPIIYHFGGLKSVLPVDVVETVDFYPGNFSTYYGRGTGGVFDAHVRDVDAKQVHGVVELSTLDISAFAETNIGEEFSIAIAGRRSVVGEIISAAVPSGAAANVIAVPVYYDGQLIANWRPNREHNFRLFGLASDDRLEFLFDNPADGSPELTGNNLGLAINFQRATLVHEYTPGEDFQNTLQFAVGRNRIDFAAAQFDFLLESLVLQGRETARWKLDDALALRGGIDINGSVTDIIANTPGAPAQEGQDDGDGTLPDPLSANLYGEFVLEAGAFVEAEWAPLEGLFLTPGIRLDYYSLVDEWAADPRLVARYAFSDKFTLKGGIGLVHQPPLPQEVYQPFGNPDATLQSAMHYSLGTEFGLPEGLGLLSRLTFDFTFFYKDLQDFITSSDARDEEGNPLYVDNTAVGRVYGLETFIEHKFADNFRGWISYTLSRSERRDAPGEDYRLFDFDQTHIFNLVASYSLPEGWEAGIRIRFISGNPYTPSQIVQNASTRYDADNDVYSNVYGATNSARVDFFSQVDLRIEKAWTFDWFRLKAYLSLINTFNRDNPEGISYSFDYTMQSYANSLPVFPNLGIRVEL